MTPRLCVCLFLVLLWQGPAQGQQVNKTAVDVPAMAMSTSGISASGAVGVDLPSHATIDLPARRETSAAGLASRVIDLLATRNAVELLRLTTDEMDAYLRPPSVESEEADVFRMAGSIYHDVTSIQSERYEINLDPLKMRCVVRIRLNRPVP